MKVTFAIALLVLTVLLTGCYSVVEPGHVGIKVNLSGGERGVSELPLATGRVFYNPITETVLEWPTYTHPFKWTQAGGEDHVENEHLTATTKDKMSVSFDIGGAVSLETSKVPNFYVKFRSDDMDAFIHGYLRNEAREVLTEVAGKYSIDQIMGDNEPFITAWRERLKEKVIGFGVVLDQFGLIGAPRPPKTVIEAINATTEATQQALRLENEVRQVQAEAAKKVAEAEGQAKSEIARAQGLAEANRIRAASITPQILDWERLEATKAAVAKWNGTPSMINGGGSTPYNFLFSLPQAQGK